MADTQACPLCDSQAFIGRVPNFDKHCCQCDVCGKFVFTPEAARALSSDNVKPQRYLLSALTRATSDRGGRLELSSKSIPEFLAAAPKPKTPYDVLEPLLLAIHAATAGVSSFVEVPLNDYPLFALTGVEQLGEFLELLRDLDLILLEPLAGRPGSHCRLTLKGWDRVAELRRAGRSGSQAFVAMSFARELDEAWREGFEPALRDAGWSPVRMDRLQHNERIDDRIIAEIRRSGLVVADFTGQRAGVYFEAGMALGLGLPVIWTVVKRELAQVHFDTRQYNHIDWEDAPDLRRRLYDRLVATIPPPGP